MQVCDIFKKSIHGRFMSGLNDEKIQERLSPEGMSLEEVFKLSRATEIVTADVAHIKNNDTEDLHKMCSTKQC